MDLTADPDDFAVAVSSIEGVAQAAASISTESPPRHGHGTRYAQWYRCTFESGRQPSARSVSRRRQADHGSLLALISLVIIMLAWMARPELNASEIDDRFVEMEASLETLRQQLQGVKMLISTKGDSLMAPLHENEWPNELSAEIVDRVKEDVRSTVVDHWIADVEQKLKDDIVAGLNTSFIQRIKDLQEEQEDAKALQRHVRRAIFAAVNSTSSAINEVQMTGMPQASVLEKADGVDWLLAINGAQVLGSTSSLDPCDGLDFMKKVTCKVQISLTVPVQMNPITILRPNGMPAKLADEASGLYPGQCWAMRGSNGFVDIQLSRDVEPLYVVIEHAPSSILVGGGDSAVKNFRVIGSRNEAEHFVLADGEYQLTAGEDGRPRPHIQRFDVSAIQSVINRVRFEVLSNHGHQGYTCIYHVRLIAQAARASA